MKVRTAVPTAPEDTRPGPMKRLIIRFGCRNPRHQPGGAQDDVLRRVWLWCPDCRVARRFDLLTGRPG